MFVSAAIVLPQLVQMIPYGSGINAGLEIGKRLGATPAESTWIVASYPLTQGAFVLMGGRIGAVYGHKNTVVVAGAFWVLFHLISGFMKSVVTLSLMRGLSGIGGAFIVPNAIALLTVTFLPGKMRNITVGFFGTTTPVGAALGSLLAGLFVQLTPWKWLFFFLAMLGAIVFTLFAFVVPGVRFTHPKNNARYYIDVQDTAYLLVAGVALESVTNERILAYNGAASWNTLREDVRRMRADFATGEYEDVEGIEISDAHEDIQRAEEILRELGRPGFIGKDEMLKNFLDAAY
ncbi:hypothetical protein LTR09_004603 [Extremus antarcticus]|uniref:Major facilitator superfamily (MFS) profile domain-containing protein n=1 Tax=Extremus antarcticus TaxID=702011 RepID=A0AAJ0DHU4_9PEZI|nr:hypothetical protein LTR09_004603 [Extremus antarcticus]